jgi:hypothetical protein
MGLLPFQKTSNIEADYRVTSIIAKVFCRVQSEKNRGTKKAPPRGALCIAKSGTASMALVMFMLFLRLRAIVMVPARTCGQIQLFYVMGHTCPR